MLDKSQRGLYSSRMTMDRFKDYFAAAVCLIGIPTLVMTAIIIYDYIRE